MEATKAERVLGHDGQASSGQPGLTVNRRVASKRWSSSRSWDMGCVRGAPRFDGPRETAKEETMNPYQPPYPGQAA